VSTGSNTPPPAPRDGRDALSIGHHSDALGNVFVYANQWREDPTQIGMWAKKHQIQALATCRSMMASKTPCATFPNGVTARFLERRDWARQPEVVELFHDYLAAGMIDLDGLMPHAGVFNIPRSNKNMLVHPLEFAILEENPDAFRLFLEVGSDATKVPSRDWLLTSGTAAHRVNGESPKDIYDVIYAKVVNVALAPIMASIVTEVTMKKVLDAVADPSAHRTSTPPRRAGRVV